jgi:DNA polymerase I
MGDSRRLLVSAGWHDKHPYLKYYNLDSGEVEIVKDRMYRNHWLSEQKSKTNPHKLVNLYDSINDRNRNLFENYGDFPEEGLTNYEHRIRKHHNYLLTKQLICGAIYSGKNLLNVELDQSQENALKRMTESVKDNQEYIQYLKDYSNILSAPIPDIKRLAVDIEVYTEGGVFPSLREAKHVVTCIGFAGSDGYRHTLMLDDENYHKHAKKREDFISYIPDEETLLRIAFATMEEYPCVVTFNGDDFDLAYLHQRAKNLQIYPIPIIFNEKDIDKPLEGKDAVLLRNGIHLDLFRIFRNRSLHNYAFNAKYKQYGLDPISMALLGEGKIHHTKALNELTQEELCKYCLNDAELTLKLTTYSNSLVMKLLILISRITKASIEDIGRFGISNWIKQMLYFEHRKKGILIPNRSDLEVKGTEANTTAIIKDKKYKGAFVMDPVKGAHFNVVCLDFASLYPSIIKANNISYETINCGHEDCKVNIIPETSHYTCTKKMGLIPLLVGVFRDLRVQYFKKLSKDKSLSKEDLEVYDAVAQAVKVILNGTYGVLGAEAFQLFCLPVAESVTAVGRFIIQETKKYTESLGLQVVYGDTDSLYVVNPSKEQQSKIIKFAQENYNIDLEVDKEYRYVMFSGLKKNYLGVKKDGKLDIKGLVGKKSNIPKFIQNAFNEVNKLLQKVNTPEELEQTKVHVGKLIKECRTNLESSNFPIEQYAFNHMIQKAPEKYGRIKYDDKNISLWGERAYKETNVPPHVKVAREMQRQGIKIEDKMFIPFVKTIGGGAKWIKFAKLTDIDKPKYNETMKKVFEPLLDVLQMNYDEVASIDRQSRLDAIFEQNI